MFLGAFDAYDLLWLLLPLAAASGWYAAKREEHARDPDFELPTAYFKGLNFLLNEQPDKAIEVFIQVLEVNSDTVETHLALGNLFRRRGEVDRAIRIHQNLIARPTLEKQQRAHALLELGQDYLKAGLLDRAENLFLELAEVRVHNEPALRFLANIYQQEREWEQAIRICRKLERLGEKRVGEVIAQYHCELAAEQLGLRNYVAAREQIKRAFGADRKCVRASILLGDAEAAEGRHREAVRAWRRIEEQDPHYMGEVAEKMAASLHALGEDAELYSYFQGLVQRQGDTAALLVLANVIERRDGAHAAEAFLLEWQQKRPSLPGLVRLVDLNRDRAPDEERRQEMTVLHGLMERLAAERKRYVCHECGFGGQTLYWQCPGCQRWNTVKPTGGDLDG
ncbi:MAG TPA: lipopolysaccharide assembly protein LapB [Acidiferrobacteraceae bacterium]|nr:lipopolysaccharide assembly protein LapB [Acidiferrobacteraceae bacterium]